MRTTTNVVAAAVAALALHGPAVVDASACSGYSNQCSLCITQESFFGSCFYCAVDNSCHDFGSVDYPSGCGSSACMSSSAFSSCSASCSSESGNMVDGFNVPTAQCLAAVSNAAYQDDTSDPLITTLLNMAGLTHYRTISTDNTFGVVIPHPSANAVIVGFRGTDASDITNILADIDINLKSVSSALDSSYASATAGWEVCDGFSTAYNTLRSQLFDALTWATGLLTSAPTIYITGHSLGGSMAELAAADLYLSGKANSYDGVHLYTFAAPRTGNAAFAEGLASLGPEVWSVQNYYDQVPHMPAQNLGYQHLENIVVVGPDNGDVVEVTPSEDEDHFDVLDPNPIDFHHVAVYQDLLDSLSGATVGTVCAAANL